MTRSDVSERLARIESEFDATVLVARDVGSRAWNLEGPDSDRDVGFVFAQAPIDYVGVGRYCESVNREIEGDSFAGWNLKRFAELLAGSNPSAIEFLNSDLEYVAGGEAWDELREYANRRFKPIALIGHYRSLAESNYEKYVVDGDDPTVKRTLYVVRALLYRRWIAETRSVPTLDLPAFVERDCERCLPAETYGEIEGTVRDLIDRKKAGRGDRTVGNPLGDWIEAELDREYDPGEYDVRGIEADRVNDHVRAVFGSRADAADGGRRDG